MTLSPNVDAGEIEKFDRVAQLWWDPSGKMGMLHVINPLRGQFVRQYSSLAGARLADIGCGGGILAEAMVRAGATVVGIDQSDRSLAVARQHAHQAGLTIDYRQQTVEQLAAQEAGSFDVVTCLEMLEHVPHPAAIVGQCARLVKPGGHVFFSTINRTFKAWLLAIVGGEYVLRILPRGTHSYRKLVRPNELRIWAAAGGLRCLGSASLIYNPFTRRFRMVSGREDVNYLLCFTRAPR